MLQGHRAEFIADVYNFANLLNSDWGATYQTGNRALLTVRGFDPDALRYIYQVNENFGVIQPGGAPYQIQLGVRYWFRDLPRTHPPPPSVLLEGGGARYWNVALPKPFRPPGPACFRQPGPPQGRPDHMSQLE